MHQPPTACLDHRIRPSWEEGNISIAAVHLVIARSALRHRRLGIEAFFRFRLATAGSSI